MKNPGHFRVEINTNDVYPVKPEWAPPSGTLSSPKEASAEKGEILLQVCSAGIAEALRREFGGAA